MYFITQWCHSTKFSDVSTDNFQIIKTIDGKATAGYFLGLGGGGRKGLVKVSKGYIRTILLHLMKYNKHNCRR